MIANKNAPEESEAFLGYFGQTEITHFLLGEGTRKSNISFYDAERFVLFFRNISFCGL